MNDLNQFGTPSNKSQKKATKAHNFIEALKDQAKAATLGTLENAVNQATGKDKDQQPATPQPQMPFNFSEYLRSRETQIQHRERLIATQQRRAETLVFHHKEQEAKEEIELLKAEIKKLVVETKDMSAELSEAEKTVMTTTTTTGAYHVSFFDRVRRLIRLARKRISESKTWLQLFNSRNRGKSHYWRQVKKSGTKFMLSQERAVATQAG